ncbi:MAG: cell division protein ZapE [Bermanella sp.]
MNTQTLVTEFTNSPLSVISPKQLYLQAVANGEVSEDSAQQAALEAINDLHQCIEAANYLPTQGAAQAGGLGLYLWGRVGRGKTYLMDILVASLAPEVCLRQHFHHFMKDVHSKLTELEGQGDPLKHIARELAEQYRVLCFDEFFVNDIGDAMLLGRLMMFLFEENMLVVATSNCEPNELYKDGLQRDSFIPAIKAIEKNMQVLEMSGPKDHRERDLEKAQNYFLTHISQVALTVKMDELGLKQGDENQYGILDVLGREIMYLDKHEDSIVFDFNDLCLGPRSHFDYIEIAQRFSTVVLVSVPVLGGYAHEHIKARGTEDGSVGSGKTGERQVLLAPMDDGARRFIALIDELYDQKVKLYLKCDVALEELYTQGSLSFQFERARSRLIEMGTKEYMAQAKTI